MAGVIKSKGNEIFTTGVQKVNTDTGSGLVTEALQRASSRMSDAMYREAVVEQREVGRQAAIKAPIKRENGNIVFEDITQDMSRVARNSARPIIEQNYARAFKVDADAALIEVRSKSKTAEEFKTRSEQVLSGMIDAVPAEFEFLSRSVMEDSAAMSQNQHYNAMLLQEGREQERVRLENLQLYYDEHIDVVRGLVVSGQIASAQTMRDGLVEDLKENAVNDGMSDQNVTSLIDKLDMAFMGQLTLREARSFLEAGDIGSVMQMERALHSGVVGEENEDGVAGPPPVTDADGNVKITIDKFGMSQAQVDSVRNYAVRQAMAADIALLRNKFVAELKDKADAVANMNLISNLSVGNNHITGDKAEKAVDTFFASQGIATNPNSWGDTDVLNKIKSNGMMMNVLINGNIMPHSLAQTFEGVANGSLQPTNEQLKNLTEIYNLTTKGVGQSGPVMRNKSLSDSTVSVWESVHMYANTYGADQIGNAVNLFTTNDRSTALQDQVKLKFNVTDGRSAQEAIVSHLISKQDDFMLFLSADKMTPGTIQRMMPIAMKAYATLPLDAADKFIESAYAAIYHPTTMIKSADGYQYKRHEFAPEAFYGTDSIALTEFKNIASNKIKAHSAAQNVSLGDTHFLMPTNQSTNRRIIWTVMDADGNYVMDSSDSSRILTIKSDAINRQSGMQNIFQQSLEKKIDLARRVRNRAILQEEVDKELEDKIPQRFP